MKPSEFDSLLEASHVPGVGRHRDPDSEFDAEELRMGIEVETEHTDNKQAAEDIAKDHLAEIPDYYTRLKRMEREGKRSKGA